MLKKITSAYFFCANVTTVTLNFAFSKNNGKNGKARYIVNFFLFILPIYNTHSKASNNVCTANNFAVQWCKM